MDERKQIRRMKKVIITGATGTIGTAMIREMVKNHIEVLVFTHRNSSRNQQIISHPLVTVKDCSLNELSTIQNDTGDEYDVFYHLAWAGTAGDARNDMYLQNQNIRYSLDAVAAAKRFGCHTFIGAGSQAEYGRSCEPLKSDTPVFPENGYGMAKLCAGQMTRDYAHQLGMAHIWVRILSIYGPNDGARTMVMSTIEKLKASITPTFTKGEQIWDYLYSDDAASAFKLLAKRGIDGKIYVLGSGNARSLKEYIKEIRQVVNPDCDINFGAVPYGEKQVMYLCADTRELHRDTGWRATTDFPDGIRRIVTEMSDNLYERGNL